jgi:hypothetical protein
MNTKNKLSFIYRIVSKYNKCSDDSELNINIIRGKEFESTLRTFEIYKIEELISKPFYTKFEDENGADQGGLS